jgi:hypothetical protein
MLFALLEAFDRQRGYLCSSKTTSQQNSNHSVVTFAVQTRLVENGKEALPLFRSQPVGDPHAVLFHSLHPTDSGRQIGTQQPAIGSLICNPADSCQAEIDGGRRIIGLLEADAVSSDDGFVESEPRLRAISVDKFADCVLVRTLRTR